MDAKQETVIVTQSPKRFEELDSLRGIASLMVVFFHFTLYREEAKLGFNLGVTGVELFFIISGFVIYMSLNRVKTSTDFIINRVSRLYPTYWTCVTITFISYLGVSFLYKHELLPPVFYLQYLANMTMFQFYMDVPNLDGPYWTMIVEMVFYICVLFLFRFRMLRHLTTIGISLILLTLIGGHFSNSAFVWKIIEWIPLLAFIPLFLAGTVFYTIYTQQKNLLRNYTVIVFCLLGQIGLFKFGGTSRMHVTTLEYSIMLFLYFGLFTLFVNHKLQFIVTKPTLFLGKISFALYLIHQHIANGIVIPFFTTRLHTSFWIGAAVALPVVIILAALVTYYIEIPFGKKMKEKLRLWTQSESTASVGSIRS
ncbi:MAG TPA: acyltransferase [Flavobacterium sp.]|nr:acyltransferase [Flavobacterium sp.]